MELEIERLYQEHKKKIYCNVDRAFAWLMIFQWAFVVAIAIFVSPFFWKHHTAANHVHVWLAVVLGGILASAPVYLALCRPGERIGRYTIAFSQMCFSALFIHLMGGRIESHFHIFGSLAFLSTYREWRLLLFAATLSVLDHYIRGLAFPFSIYGATQGVQWRWLEHSAWILFECLFLSYACIRASTEIRQIAASKAELAFSRTEADKLNIRRAEFFSLISHEIRTPLSGIIGFADFLNESPIEPEQREYVSIIKQCSDTLLKLINDLLDFNKIDSGHLEIDPHPFKVRDLQRYLENVFFLICQKKNLKFLVEVSNEVPEELYGDSHRIRQVLTNIIGNAVKFTEAGGIRVRVSRDETRPDLYRWDVEDTGIGIKKDSLTKIFSPYTQESSSTARKYGGSGLGLAISKTLVELMGGQMNVRSTLGKGTLFFFTLPLK